MPSNVTYLFLDESGDHSLDKIDPQYPIFVLGGALIRNVDYDSVERSFHSMKAQYFGTKDIILHTADMVRNRNGFERMREAVFRTDVYKGLNHFMREAEYRVVSCAIRKDEHLNKYGLSALDPYHLALRIIVERAFFAVGGTGKLHIIAERRNPGLDRMLEIAFLELKINGTGFIKPSAFARAGIELHLRDKKKNITGLQIADLLVSPIGRYVLGKTTHEDWRIIQSRFYRYRDKWEGAGLVVLPQNKKG